MPKSAGGKFKAERALRAVRTEEAASGDATVIEEAAARVGARDVLVFRRLEDDVVVHVGGAGQGSVWTGSAKLLLAEEPQARAALEKGVLQRRHANEPGHVIGSYYARHAAIVPYNHEVFVVLGGDEPALRSAGDEELEDAARSAARGTVDVSPAQSLADEVAILTVVRSLYEASSPELEETMRRVCAVVATSLRCELVALHLPAPERIEMVTRDWPDGGEAPPATAIMGALVRMEVVSDLPSFVQDAAAAPLPEPLGPGSGVTGYAAVGIGEPAFAVLLACRTSGEPFTDLERRMIAELAGAAQRVLDASLLRNDQQREIDRLQRESRRDPATGLANGLAWDEALADQDKRLRRVPGTASILVLMLDTLAEARRTGGEEVAAEMLRAVATIVKGAIRETDYVARAGGEQLSVLLRDTDEETCVETIKRVQRQLIQHPGIDGHPLSVTVGHAGSPPAAALDDAQFIAVERAQARRLTG